MLSAQCGSQSQHSSNRVKAVKDQQCIKMASEGNTMDNKLYNEKASSQAVAHDLTKASLVKCVEEVVQKFPGTLRMCDLGSAGGVNALKLLRWILPLVGDRKVDYVFEDLPNADLNELAKTIQEAGLPENISTGW